jgi:hypothetical protein
MSSWLPILPINESEMNELASAKTVAGYGRRVPKRGILKELARLLATLPPGRLRVAWALLADSAGRTYPQVAMDLGLHLGTVHQHLRRIRLRHPKVYAAVMNVRARQLAARHRRARARAEAHSKRWFDLTRGLYIPMSG